MNTQVKVISVKFTMFNVEGSEDFYDCTVRGAKQKLRNKCETVIVHETTERTLELISEETLKCEDKFEIVPTHPNNKVEQHDSPGEKGIEGTSGDKKFCEFKSQLKTNI